MNGAWIKVAGQIDPNLGRELSNAVNHSLTEGSITEKEISHVSGLGAAVVKGELLVNDIVLEKLRTLCMSWDIDIKPREISSHRPIIGPLIVAAKKMIYPVLRALLHDTIQAQRHFNGTAISVLAEIANSEARKTL